MKSGGVKHEMTLFHTIGPNRNVLFQTHLFVNIYGLMWSYFNITVLQCVIGYTTSLYLVKNSSNLYQEINSNQM